MAAPATTNDAAQHMDGIYRTQRHIYDATRKFYLLGRDQLLADLAPADGGRVLEVACGTGRNLILAAQRYPRASFYGFDISSEMLQTATASLAKAGLCRRVTLAHGDATQFSPLETFGMAAFDRVFISYAVSMIPPWREALATAFAAVAPGGKLLVVDFGQQSALPTWCHDALSAWLARFSVTPRGDLEAEMARIAAAEGAALSFRSLYRDYARYGIITKRG